MHVRIQENSAVNNPMYLRGDLEEDEVTLDHAVPLQDKVCLIDFLFFDCVFLMRQHLSRRLMADLILFSHERNTCIVKLIFILLVMIFPFTLLFSW